MTVHASHPVDVFLRLEVVQDAVGEEQGGGEVGGQNGEVGSKGGGNASSLLAQKPSGELEVRRPHRVDKALVHLGGCQGGGKGPDRMINYVCRLCVGLGNVATIF